MQGFFVCFLGVIKLTKVPFLRVYIIGGDEMLIAQSQTNELIYALKIPNKNYAKRLKMHCPACHKPVIFKAGKKMTPHFAHKINEACLSHSEGETKEHLAGKRQLLAHFREALGAKNVRLEAVLPTINQRADVLVRAPTGKIIALEYQCSPLSLEHLISRTQGYLGQKMQVVWLLGKRHRIKKRLTAQTAMFMRFHPHLGFYLLYYDASKQQFELNYEIQTCDFAPVKYCRFTTKNFGDIQKFCQVAHRKRYSPLNLTQRQNQLRRFYQTINQPTNAILQLAEQVYLASSTLSEMGKAYLSQAYTYPLFDRWQFFWRVHQHVAVQNEAKFVTTGLVKLPLVANLERFWTHQEELRQNCGVEFSPKFRYTQINN